MYKFDVKYFNFGIILALIKRNIVKAVEIACVFADFPKSAYWPESKFADFLEI